MYIKSRYDKVGLKERLAKGSVLARQKHPTERLARELPNMAFICL
jgi:hypothetical protein